MFTIQNVIQILDEDGNIVNVKGYPAKDRTTAQRCAVTIGSTDNMDRANRMMNKLFEINSSISRLIIDQD